MRSACAGALALVAGSGVFANASQTPGRIVFPLVPVASTTSLATPVAPVRADTLDDGRVLIATRAADGSLVLLRLLPSGALDEAFGVAGSVRLTAAALVGTDPVAVVALSDASAYIVVKPAQEKLFPALSVAHVLANGGLDAGYGRGGVASTAATWRDPLAGWYDPAEVAQSDGRLVLSSASGRPIRLLTDGREDPDFAAPTPTMGSSGTIGAVLSDGRIALIDGIGRLVVLRSDGSVDPGFNAGPPWSSGDVLSALLPGPDGTIDVFGSVAERISSTGNVLREAPLAGAPSAGSLAFREPDGGTLVIAPQGRHGTLLITLDAAFARVAIAPYSPPAFGGAYSQPDVVRGGRHRGPFRCPDAPA